VAVSDSEDQEPEPSSSGPEDQEPEPSPSGSEGQEPEPSPSGTSVSALRRSLIILGLALVPFLLARVLLYCVYHEDFEGFGVLRVAGAFVGGLRFDVAASFMILVLPVAMLNLPFPFARHQRWIAAWGWVAFFAIVSAGFVLAADLVYYRDVRRHFARELVLIAHDGVFVFGMMAAYWYLVLIFGAVVGAAGWGWRKLLQLEPPAVEQRPYLKLAVLAVVFAMGIRGSVTRKPLNPTDAYRTQSFELGNLQLNGVFTAIKTSMHNWDDIDNPMPLDEAYDVLGLDGKREFPLLRVEREVKATGRNVLIMLLESWDTRYIGSYGSTRQLTPNFDAFARESLQFEQVFASTQRTVGGVQAVLTGIPPVPGVPELSRGLEHTTTTRIAAIAKSHGYSTVFIQGPRRASYYLDAVMHALGFDVAYGKEDIPLVKDYGGRFAKWGWDHDAYQFALAQMDTLKPPFFVVLLSGTTHSPYADPGKEFHVREHTKNGENGYMNTLSYSDWGFGEFVKGAKQRDWYKNTTWIVGADHVYRSDKSQHLRENFRIPVLMHGPGITPGHRDGIRSQLDYLPTVMEVCGFGDAYSAFGKSLLGPPNEFALVKRGNVLGAVAPFGDLSHTLQDRLSVRSLDADADTSASFDRLERQLRAVQKVTTTLVAENRWARR
jgi:phosphoglycerol transferase MdoB-like AlkP superfamily enzyme